MMTFLARVSASRVSAVALNLCLTLVALPSPGWAQEAPTDAAASKGAQPSPAQPSSSPTEPAAPAGEPKTAPPAADTPPPVDDPQADGQTAQASTTEAVAPAGATDNGGYDAVAPPSTAGLVAESSAQGDGRRTIVAYSTAMSVGSTNDFIDQFSFAGFSFDWRSRLKEKFWAGVSIGWQVLYNKAERTSEIGNVALTGTQVRHLNTFPLLLTGHYYHSSEDGKIQPYGGLGAGVYASEWRVDVGLLTASSVTWHFGLAPELGVVLPMGSNRFSLSSRFNYAFESGGNPEILFFTFAFGVELD